MGVNFLTTKYNKKTTSFCYINSDNRSITLLIIAQKIYLGRFNLTMEILFIYVL